MRSFAFKTGVFSSFVFFLLTVVVLMFPELTSWEGEVLKGMKTWQSELVLKFARDLGALGSTVIVVLFSTVTMIVLLLLRRRLLCAHFFAAIAGSGIITGLAKAWVTRPRPTEMAESLGFYTSSYPSGHTNTATAMYLTIAIIAIKEFKNHSKVETFRAARSLITIAMLIAILVAIARTVTSTHFPTDSIAGIFAGIAWACFMTALFSFFAERLKEK